MKVSMKIETLKFLLENLPEYSDTVHLGFFVAEDVVTQLTRVEAQASESSAEADKMYFDAKICIEQFD